METLASDVWATLSASGDGRDLLIAHGGSNARMPLWLPGALWRTVRAVRSGRVRHVLVGDVLLYLLMRPVLVALGVRHATMAMGKDVVWDQPLYRWVVRRVLPRAPRVLAISAATAASVVDAGARPERVAVVRLGVAMPAVTEQERAAAVAELRARHGVPGDALVVLTLGRLVRRKGVPWFVEHVLPRVDGVVYLVAGSGPEREAVAAAVGRHELAGRVHLLGAVSDADRELLMRGADVFVQPNVQVAGDMEGFGLVAVEAAGRGALVLAADLEGLQDAVLPGETGELLPSGEADAWVAALGALRDDPEGTRARGSGYAANARDAYARERMGQVLRAALGLGTGGPA
jgi:glycosyltransferase involved in cell wall biosynthesis